MTNHRAGSNGQFSGSKVCPLLSHSPWIQDPCRIHFQVSNHLPESGSCIFTAQSSIMHRDKWTRGQRDRQTDGRIYRYRKTQDVRQLDSDIIGWSSQMMRTCTRHICKKSVTNESKYDVNWIQGLWNNRGHTFGVVTSCKHGNNEAVKCSSYTRPWSGNVRDYELHVCFIETVWRCMH